MALRGACGVHNALELERRDNVLALAVRVFVVFIELNRIEAGRDDDRAVLLGDDLILLGVINRTRL